MLRRINEALPGLVAGIIGYGVVIQLTGVWFVSDKLGYSIGLWFGIAVAVGLAINIATVIFDSVVMGDSKQANRRIIAKSVLRYVVVVILFFILGYFQFGNLFTAFLGVLGLKISAYLQPLFGKVSDRIHGRIREDSEVESNENVTAQDQIYKGTEQIQINKEVTM
ncbi:MAG: hypothetical protein PUA77_03185 [Lachnospiraceae bacterium]|nr:hypothetical protein [Agathobacter sp.]MDD6290783.1 hypothetical protein [Lachnospiraceae bacterium]